MTFGDSRYHRTLMPIIQPHGSGGRPRTAKTPEETPGNPYGRTYELSAGRG